MRFYDRERELHVLGEMLHRSKSEAKMTVLMGRRQIDLIVVDPIGKEAWIYELKKQGDRYKENEFREKVDKVLEQTPELRKMTIHIGSLSLEDM